MLLLCVLPPKALLPRSTKLLPIFPGGRSHFSLNFWASLVTVHQISAELCPNENLSLGDNLHEMSEPNIVSGKNKKKNVLYLLSAELAKSEVRIKSLFMYIKSALCRYQEVLILTISFTVQYHHINYHDISMLWWYCHSSIACLVFFIVGRVNPGSRTREIWTLWSTTAVSKKLWI